MPLVQQILGAVKVLKQAAQQPGALDDSRLNRAPLIGGNEKWNNVDLPGTIRAQRVAVNVVSDSVFADASLCALPAPAQFFWPMARNDSIRLAQCGRGVTPSADNSSYASP
jgi:hypothetical protein